MPTKEELKKEKAEALEILKNATDAANALTAKKESANKSKAETSNSELEDLKKMVLEQQASLSGMKGELVALGEERQKLEQEVIPVAEIEETKPEITEIKEEITTPEETPENTEAKQEEIKVIPEPEKIPENKPKTKAEKRAENRKKNGIEEKPKKDKQKIDETREKVLASMEQKEEEKEEIKNLDLEDKKDADKDTLEQKVEYFNLTGKDINRIAQKIKDKEYLEADDRALYEQNPQLFESAVKTKWRSATSWLAGGYLWLQQKFLTTPKTEKIVITDEEIAENHPETVVDEDKETKKAEYAKRLHETLSITDMGAAYGIERAKMATDAPEIQEENKKPKKESSKEREARLTQEFIEKVQNQIDAKMTGEWKGASENERAEKARALYVSEKQIFDKEKIERAGIFTKSLHATENWWKNLENKKGGVFWKTAISSSMVGTGIVLGGIATGSLEANVGKIAWRLGSRIGLATGLNSMLASNRMKTIISGLKPKDQADIKKMKYVLAGTGIAVSGIMGGWVVAGIAAGGYGVRQILNKIDQYGVKKIAEQKMETEKILKSADFKDGYDRNKMIENISIFNDAYNKLEKTIRLENRYSAATKYILSTGIGLATLTAMTPSVAHAENDHSHVGNKLEDKIQEQPASTKSDSTNIDQKTAIDSSQIKSIDQNTTAPITNPEPKTPEIEFTEVKEGDGVTQTLKRLVDEDKVPKWVMDELGKNPKADDYAKFAEKFGMLHAEDFEDSIRVSKGDSFGFDEKENFVWKHGDQNYTVIEIDKNGDAEEGDWMDKMQDEKFIHSQSNHINSVENSNQDLNAENPETGDKSVNTGGEGNPSEEKIDPNKIVEPEPLDNKNAPIENIPENTTGPTVPPETNIEPTNMNPYSLPQEQLDYVNDIYKNYLERMFPNNESLKYWSGIQNNSALDLIQVKIDVVATESRGLYRLAQTIFHQTGLEPKHPTLANPLEEKETIKNYIIRGMQYAASKNKLNQITL